MICPVCKRELAPTLSICLTCGAMMNDTVREELETKIEKLPVVMSNESFAEPPVLITDLPNPPAAPLVNAEKLLSPVARPRPITAGLGKRDTSPTLIEFQHKNPLIPDWRLQLQNTVRKRTTKGSSQTVDAVAAPAIEDLAIPTAVRKNGTAIDNVQTASPRSEKITNALKRIEESRRAYSSGAAAGMHAARVAKRQLPSQAPRFNVVERSAPVSKAPVSNAPVPETPRPKLVSPLRIEKKKFDTNKLPPIPEPDTPLEEATHSNGSPSELGPEVKAKARFGQLNIRKNSDEIEILEANETEYEEIDDLAPFSMRFGAAVFDLIIGGFAAAILLSPFLVSNANLASVSGVLAILGAVLVVMFVYMTATVAFMGRTLGMKLFSLEIIDVEENGSPTLHQAAVNSAVYLLSLLFCGIGFIPAFFNEERRTVHDILSGTLLIREY